MKRAFVHLATQQDPKGEAELTRGWSFLLRFSDQMLLKAIVHQTHDDPGSEWTVSDITSGVRVISGTHSRRCDAVCAPAFRAFCGGSSVHIDACRNLKALGIYVGSSHL